MPNFAFRRLGRGLLALTVAMEAIFGGLLTPGIARAATAVQLTEFAPSSGSSFIEIKNPSATDTVDVSGYRFLVNGAERTVSNPTASLAPGQIYSFNIGSVVSSRSTSSLSASVVAPDGSSDSVTVGLLQGIPAPDDGKAVALLGAEWWSNLMPTPNFDNAIAGTNLPDQPSSLTVGAGNTVAAANKTAAAATVALSSFTAGKAESLVPFALQTGVVKAMNTNFPIASASPTFSWNLSDLASGPATAGVFIETAGGIRSQIIRTSITIEGDTAGPTAGAFTVTPTLTTSQTVNLKLTNIADNVSTPANIWIDFSNDGITWGSATDLQGQPNNLKLRSTDLPISGVSWTLTPGVGQKTIFARLSDQQEGGNQTVLTRTVELEDSNRLTPPGTITLPAGSTTPEIHPFASGADDVVINNLSIKSDSAVTLTASRYADNPYPNAPRPEGYIVTSPFINLRLDPSASVNFPVTIRIYFTQANSKLAGAMFYDYASASWKLYQGAEGTAAVSQTYVEIKANHLTPIALAAKTEVLAPANLTATAGDGQVTLKWDARSSASSYFVIYHAVGSTTQIQTNDITGLETTITGLVNGTKYEFQVFGRDTFGNISADHATATTTPTLAPEVLAPAPAAPAAPVKPAAAKKKATTVQTEAERQASAAQATAIDALKTVENNIDKVVTIFRSSADNTEIKQRLMNELGLTDSQADAILNLRQAVINKNGGPFAVEADEKAALLAEIKARLNEPVSAAELLPSPSPAPTESPAPTPSPAPGEEPEATPSKTPWIVLGILIALAAAATAGYFYWFKEEDEDEGPPPPPRPPKPPTPPPVTPSTQSNGGVKTTVRGPGARPSAPPPPPPPPSPADKAPEEKPAPPPPPKPKDEPPPRW